MDDDGMDEETRRAIELSMQPDSGGEDGHSAALLGQDLQDTPPSSLLEMAAELEFPEWKVRIAWETKGKDADEAVEFMLRHGDKDESWWRDLGGQQQQQALAPDLLSALYMQGQQQQPSDFQPAASAVPPSGTPPYSYSGLDQQHSALDLRQQADAEDQHFNTPLMRAAVENDSEQISTLLDRGATIDKQNAHGTQDCKREVIGPRPLLFK